MTAAFVLGINMSIAGIFAAAFAVVAATNRTARGAWWLACGYGSGILNVLLEFAIYGRASSMPFAIAIFVVYLFAVTACLIGVARHYRVDLPWRTMAAIWAASICAIPLIFSLTYGTPLRGFLYQFPYFAMQLLVGLVIWRSGRRQPLDILLVGLNTVASSLYLLKPLIAIMIGTATAPQGYMETNYAAVSQSLASVTLIALALVLLLVMMRDTTAEMAARLETDPLTDVFNRRGFDAHAERLLRRAKRDDQPLVLIIADLDHFKSINDSFGHAVGDQVIVQFACLLRQLAESEGIVSRLGGEEFAVVCLGANLGEGRRYAEAVRTSLSAEPLLQAGVDRVVTASFGVAQMLNDDDLIDLFRRADGALYRAKAGGRNRVSLALGEFGPVPVLGQDRIDQPDRAFARREVDALPF